MTHASMEPSIVSMSMAPLPAPWERHEDAESGGRGARELLGRPDRNGPERIKTGNRSRG
jgi:hypothetical protein